MSKRYGLILPGQYKKTPQKEVSREYNKPSIFDESSSESDDSGPPQMILKKVPMGPSLLEKRKVKNLQERALAEDPTIYQYDELFDEMESKRKEEKDVRSKEPKKAQYVIKLMEAAEKRKLENELRIERQVQKEREAEGDEFKDKESFVTSTYRKKLEEMRKLEEQNKRDDYLEAIGDVTKQKDLDGFYRHIYEQKVGVSKSIKASELQPEVTNAGDSDEDGVAYRPINSGKNQKQRTYRKRKSSDEEIDEDKKLIETQDKKIHLTNNIDADSDFSIDDSSSESENDVDKKTCQGNVKTFGDLKKHANNEHNSNLMKTALNTIALNFETLKPQQHQSQVESSNNDKKTPLDKKAIGEPSPPLQKRDKSEVWRTRTVGDVYLAAVQRYYERKSLRSRV